MKKVFAVLLAALMIVGTLVPLSILSASAEKPTLSFIDDVIIGEEEKNGVMKTTATFIGAIQKSLFEKSRDEIYDSVTMELVFTGGNLQQPKTFTNDFTNVYSTVRGVASTKADTAAAQGIMFVDDDVYLFVLSIIGIEFGSYNVSVSLIPNKNGSSIDSEKVETSVDIFVNPVVKAINGLKQTGAYTAEDVEQIIAVRDAFDALTSAEQSQVSNVALLEAAEAKMLTIFDFNADNMSNFNAGLYGANSACQVQVGYTDETVGGVTGAGWYSTAVKEGAFLAEADTNGDGYANDDASSYIGTNFAAENAKTAYQALLDAGYTTVTFNFYLTAAAGNVDVWCRYADAAGCFFWLGTQPLNTWVTVELPLDKFVENFDGIRADMFSLISINVNTATTLTEVYLTDVVVKSIDAGDLSTVRGIKKAINSLKQVGAYTGEDIQAIREIREAYKALSAADKAAVDNIALLDAAEANMLKIFDFNEDNVANFKAGLYGANSACQVQVGYTDETIGGVAGTGWYSTAIKDGEFLLSEDTNGDGYANDNASSYIGMNFAAQHTKSAYQALLDAGYTTVTFNFYLTAAAGNVDVWCRYADAAGCFFWLGTQPFNTWVTVELPLDKFVENFDGIRADMFSLISLNVNTATTLTAVYLTDVVVKNIDAGDLSTVSGIKKAIGDLKQVGAYSGEDVQAIMDVRAAYDALSASDKAAVDNVALLESAEEKMVVVFDFNEDSVSSFKAGLYGANSACQVQVGYTDETIGGVVGAGWYSTAIKQGEFLLSEDTNGDGYANDNASTYIGMNFAAQHTKAAYQALLDAGYTTVTFNFYLTAEAGTVDVWCRYADAAGCFFWLGTQPFNTWVPVELPLDLFVENFDGIRADMFSLVSLNINTATTLTTIYLTDVVVA